MKWSSPSLERSDDELILDIIESANYGDYVRLRLSLKDGRVKLTVPWKTKSEELLGFLRRTCGWTRKNLARQRQKNAQRLQASTPYSAKIDSEGWVYLQGKKLALKPTQLRAVQLQSGLDGEEPVLLVPEFSDMPPTFSRKLQATMVSRFLKRQLCEIYSERGLKICSAMRLFPRQFLVSNALTSWGSCNAKGVVRLSWPLACLPAKYFDYVLVHELAHLVHMNHSAAFWSLVERFCPDYRQTRKELREIGLKSIFAEEIFSDSGLQDIFRHSKRLRLQAA